MRPELQPALDQARQLPAEELPRLLADLEEVRVTALARLTSPTLESRPDELLSVEETARRMNVSKDYLYHHHKRFPFVRHVGRKLLFSAAGLDTYLKKSR
jgi:excisionase family DNA binding protein